MQYTNSEIERRIEESIHSSRDRRIMHLRLVDGYTHERIAEEMQMSTRQIKNIVKRCMSVLFPDTVFTEICFS